MKLQDSQLIGLTGGIASGKSVVSQIVSNQGYAVIDADKLGHRVLDPNHQGYQQIVQTFGEEILNPDGSIHRPSLGNIVFSDPQKLQQLNEISHPWIGRMIHEQYDELKKSSKHHIVFLEAALLLEGAWKESCDIIWVVVVEPEIAILRLQDRNGFSRSQAQQRLDSQMTNEERLPFADVLINNNGSLDELKHQVLRQLQKLSDIQLSE